MKHACQEAIALGQACFFYFKKVITGLTWREGRLLREMLLSIFAMLDGCES
jgi:hypothetical protein